MTDKNDKSGDDAKKTERKPLSLKAGKGGTVRQNFSHGRSKSVVVETKKRRVIGGPGKTLNKPAAPAKPKPKIDPDALAAQQMGLSKSEYLKRKSALDKAQAQAAEREAAKQAEAAERKRRAEEEREALARKKEEEKREAEVKARREAEEARRAEAEAAAATEEPVAKAPRKEKRKEVDLSEHDDAASALEAMGGRVKKSRSSGGNDRGAKSRSRVDEPKRRHKLTIVSALAGDEERQRSLASMKRAREREKQRRSGGSGGKDKIVREVTVPETITIADLANRMAERGRDVVKFLMQQGEMLQVNDTIDADMAELIVEEFGHTVKRVAESDVEDAFIAEGEGDDPKDLKPRPPVIAVMGHVDHGKTSLLDALRSTNVASGEAGGITQHIGAYQLKLKNKQTITVLDTPGHAAFSAMRTRGAQAVDIVILVVAADDGIMPQTIESISHAKASGAPMIVAINKMDVPGANPQKVETDLLQHEVITESMSGDVQTVQVSAKTKAGMDDLIDAINLQAELLELKANPDRPADGVVIESKIEKGRGPVATLLVKRGTLKRGDVVVAGEYWGKVKAQIDENGKQQKATAPGIPIAIMGLDGTPDPGEPFSVVEDEGKAKEIVDYRLREKKKARNTPVSAMASMEQMMAKLADNTTQELTFLVKADVQGSAEAIRSSLEGLSNSEVKARVVYTAAGGISESDILLAKSSEAPVIGFNVRANRQAKELAEKEGVEIRYYSVIYDLIDDVKDVLEGLLAPERRETFIGYAEILQVFDISKLGNVAGCLVTEGRVERGAGVRLLRDDVVIHEGELSTLRRFKDEVESVQSGTECGMGFKGYHDLKKGDLIECFTVKEVKRKLDDVNKAEDKAKKSKESEEA